MFIALTSTYDLTQPFFVRASAIIAIETLDQETTLVTVIEAGQITVKETRHKVRELVEGSRG